MGKKIVIMDSSSIISLSMNSLLYLLQRLKKSDVRFIITEDVKKEVIETPLQIKKYELEALLIQQLIREKILEMPDVLGVSPAQIENGRDEFLETANHTFEARDEWIRIISNGEASCFALAKIATKKGFNAVVMVDERTARMLCEKPGNLQKLLGSKLHTEVNAEKSNFAYFSGYNIIRSSELCYAAYKKGLIGISDGRQLVDALLYAVKFKGCAISSREIETLKKIS